MSPQVQSPDLLQIECDYETSKMGALVTFGGIIMLFITFLATFSSMVAKELAYITLNETPIIIGGISSIILIISSVMFHLSYRQWKMNSQTRISIYLMASVGLGIVFLLGQINLWQMLVAEGLTSRGNVLAGMVYLIGSVHAVRLIVGLTVLGWLIYQLKMPRKIKLVRYQLIGWFWHFLTVLWCIIFSFFLIVL